MARRPAHKPVQAEKPIAAPVEPIAPVEAPEPAVSPNLIYNCVPHTTLHLGDGRTLLHGEGAEVSAEIAAFLRERGQAE